MSSNGFQPRITTTADYMLLLNFFNETTRQIDRLIERQNHMVETLMDYNRTPNPTFRDTEYQHPSPRRTPPRYRTTRYHSFSEPSSETNLEHSSEPINEINSSHSNLRQHLRRRNTTETTPSSTPATFDNFVLYSFLPERTENLFEEFFNTILIRPTEQQIANATSTCTFGGLSDPKNTSCPITLNVFQSYDTVTRINECGHLYTPSALAEWFNNNTHCPLCRYDIRESASL